jgi:TonB family protein
MTAHVKASLVACAVAALIVVMPSGLQAQESLATARQLYVSAEYADALTMLNGLLATNPSPQERQAINLYRTLCLVAVGNAAEANKSIEAMIAHDPLYRPGAEEIPPRLRSAFSDARRRLLPSIIQQKYVVAKAAYDQKDFSAAAEGFEQVLNGLSDPDIALATEQPPLSDLRVLATGFHDLTVKATAPPPPPAAAPVAAVPVVERIPRIYTTGDANVVPPLVIKQTVPPFPGKVLLAGAAVIEVVIDDKGTVESAVMETPLNPQYDRLALVAARAWLYQPARVDGAPVKFRKRIQVTLVPNR